MTSLQEVKRRTLDEIKETLGMLADYNDDIDALMEASKLLADYDDEIGERARLTVNLIQLFYLCGDLQFLDRDIKETTCE
jgi:hypothetical protein